MMTSWVYYEMKDADNMDVARERMEMAKEFGIDRLVLEIHGYMTAQYPQFERTLMDKILFRNRGYKSSEESPQEYIERMVWRGENFRKDGSIYIVKDGLVLEFEATSEGTEEKEQLLSFYDVARDSTFGEGWAVDLEDIYDIVSVREHFYRLDYDGWGNAPELHERIFPGRIVFY